MQTATPVPPARAKLLMAAMKLVRQKGYDATTVDELCQEAGVTKGAFFHHFENKEAVAVAATKFWTEFTGQVFATAPYHQMEDPLDQLIGYIDFRRQLLEGRSLPECTCLLGTMAQEKFETSPAIRAACFDGIHTHATEVAKMISAAKLRHAPNATWGAESLALYTQAVIQGAFVLAKAKDDVALAADMILHLRRYVELLFHHARED
ncbi:MAG: TetR/AcrR family transcriptional regulator [Alphaproteobacteria bacterium]|nr:TetR/AcrR family transcriptional regulator [Alphaproteobacteria bacterium]